MPLLVAIALPAGAALALISCGDSGGSAGGQVGSADAAVEGAAAEAGAMPDAAPDAGSDAAPEGPCTTCIEGAVAGTCAGIYAPCGSNPPCQMLHACAVTNGCFEVASSAFGTCVSQRCEDLLGSRFDWYPTLDCAFGACKPSCSPEL